MTLNGVMTADPRYLCVAVLIVAKGRPTRCILIGIYQEDCERFTARS